MSPAPPARPTIFTSRFNRMLAVAIWVVLALIGAGVLTVPLGTRWLYLIPLLFGGLLVLEAFWRPVVTVSESGVVLRNVLRTVSIPWSALIHVDTRFALTLYTPGHRYAAWAAPAPGKGATLRASRAEQPLGMRSQAPRPGDLLGTDSGEAARIVRLGWERALESGVAEAGAAETTPVQLRQHWTTAAALAVLAAGSMAALLLG